MITIHCKNCTETTHVFHLEWESIICNHCQTEIENPYAERRDLEIRKNDIRKKILHLAREKQKMEIIQTKEEHKQDLKRILRENKINITPKRKK